MSCCWATVLTVGAGGEDVYVYVDLLLLEPPSLQPMQQHTQQQTSMITPTTVPPVVPPAVYTVQGENSL